MLLKVLRSTWGMGCLQRADPHTVLARIRQAGFDGLEGSLADLGAAGDAARLSAWSNAALATDTSFVLSVYSSWANYEGPDDSSKSMGRHLDTIMRGLEEIATAYHPNHSPIVGVNVHAGTDAWSEAEATRFFVDFIAAKASLSLPWVAVETHRGRCACCPFITARILAHVPQLRITSDFAHWILKCERLLDAPEEEELLRSVVAPATDHIHARVGTPQQAQVPHVSDPMYSRAAERCARWWETVWSVREASSMSARGSTLTATVEYGPPEMSIGDGQNVGYSPLSAEGWPVSGMAHQDVVIEAAQHLRQRFDEWHGRAAFRRMLG